jgi:hypothetical protein
LQLYTPNSGSSQQYLFVPMLSPTSDGSEEVFVIIAACSGLALDVSSSAQVVQQPWTAAATQRWRVTAYEVGHESWSLENVGQPGRVALPVGASHKGAKIGITPLAPGWRSTQWMLTPHP